MIMYVFPDKAVPVVSKDIPMQQLQSPNLSDNCIESLDLRFAMYVAHSPLRLAVAAFVC